MQKSYNTSSKPKLSLFEWQLKNPNLRKNTAKVFETGIAQTKGLLVFKWGLKTYPISLLLYNTPPRENVRHASHNYRFPFLKTK